MTATRPGRGPGLVRIPGRVAFSALAALAAGVALAAATPARAADVRRLEAVGAVGLPRDGRPETPPRDAALRKALSDAVERVALEQLSQSEPNEVLGEILGDDPLAYITRFRILEDRGERPAIFVDDPEVEFEYVVMVEVYVDADRVREQLADSGLVTEPSGEGTLVKLRVVVRELDSHAAYAALRETLLERVGARSVVPVEMERGRALLEVEANRAPDALVAALLREAPPELRIDVLGLDSAGLTLRAAWVGSGDGAPARSGEPGRSPVRD